jgi:hypothetical protein
MGKAAWIRGGAAGIAGLIALWGAWTLLRDPTPEERRSNLREWVAKTEAACTTAFTSIAGRGTAVDIVDLDRVVVRADRDLRRAFDRIRRLDEPKGSAGEVKAVHAAMARVERDMTAVARSSEDADRPALRRLASALRADAQHFVNATVDAGARECAPLGLPSLASDAVLGPVFAQDFAAVHVALGRRLQRALNHPAGSPMQLAGRFGAATEAFGDAGTSFDRLTIPARASDAARAYGMELSAMRQRATRLQHTLAGPQGRDPRRVLPLARRFDRGKARMIKLGKRLLVAAQAQPIGDPGPEPTANASEQPA